MNEEELKLWLARTAAAIRDDEIALLLGWRARHVPARAGDALRFAIAVLRDVYARDEAVARWLEKRRPELRGLSALDCLMRDRSAHLDRALVRRWNLAVERGVAAIPRRASARAGFAQSAGRERRDSPAAARSP